MAISATAVWELRATGAANNGAGYDAGIAGATTDYSLQDAAQLTLTDLACVTGTATLTSVTGGFTDAMIGNAIAIDGGTNFTKGYYFITARTDTSTVTLDRTPVGGSNGSSGTGKVGGAATALKSSNLDLAAALIGGNQVWIKNGTYSTFISASDTVASGTATALIKLDGYNSTRGDNPTGTNRPLLQYSGTFGFTIGTNNQLANLIFSATRNGGTIFTATLNGTRAFNCKFVNAGTATSVACTVNGMTCIRCEFQAVNGNAISTSTATLVGCYIHDSTNGIVGTGAITVDNCIVDTCATAGIDISGGGPTSILNSTIYGCGTGITVGTTLNTRLVNTIISGCTGGWASTNSSPGYLYNDFNCWNNGAGDGANLVKGANDITGDPLLNDPANGDFTLRSTSPALGVGAANGAVTGASGAYKWNIGADQDDNTAAGGGGGWFGGN
jgi:hypothetical protein